MYGRPTWTDCDEAGDNVVPNVLSQRDLVFRPDNMDETVPHTYRRIVLNSSYSTSSLPLLSLSSALGSNVSYSRTSKLCLSSLF